VDETERSALSRRRVVSAVGLGVAAMGAPGTALAQERNQRTGSPRNSEPKMEVPRSKYPKPPFIKVRVYRNANEIRARTGYPLAVHNQPRS
jgi:hypothetical protein